ncbi:polyprenyl diphosphate synthase [Acidimicrobium ferrooxidans]|uniref:polyprenyl diphosphate synthase n=1 Tax=Acidimicrobium ferrooxidans TaxID=53635 RepID=UPI00019DE13C|nr:polyprenyl diphosphate synthase [Acidimicrobium ferrooxidans]
MARPSEVPSALERIDTTRVPLHVAFVMDGNGRWAQRYGLPRTQGHAAGETALFDVVEGALEVGVRWLTVYAFSTENWRRPPDEVRFLMNFNRSLLRRRRDELNDRGVRIRFLGRRSRRVPPSVTREMDLAAELTAHNDRLTLTMAFNYGGRAEIVDALRRIVAEGVPARAIDESTVASHLYFPDMPDPDLVVRTSGEYRISNFLLWQLAYAELVFLDTLWPDVRREHLFEAIAEYQGRDRRFGGVGR